MRKTVVILVSMALLLLSACGGATAPEPTRLPSAEPAIPPAAPTPAPTAEPVVGTITSAEELLGVWHSAHAGGTFGDVFYRYSADGTMRSAASAEQLDTEPRTESEYWFENGVFHIRDTGGLPGWDACVQSKTIGKYRLEVLANGNVRTVLIEDGCEMRAMFKAGKETVRVP